MVQKQEKKTERCKIPPDIIMKVVRAVKLHNLSSRKVTSKFNMNYRPLVVIERRFLKKIIYTRILLFQQLK